MTTEGPLANSQILRECEVVLSKSLPPDWRLNIIYGDSRNTGVADAVFSLVTPQGETIDYVIEVQSRPTTRRVLDTADQVYGYLENGAFRGSALIIADYLSPRSRQVLKDANVSFVDATGNVRLVNASPGLFIEASGARKNPWTEDVPLRSLKGRGAGRAIRALVDTRPPFGVRQLGLKTSVPIATLSRVIDLLERDALLDRDEDGGVVAVDWMNTIRRWSTDYELRKSNTIDTYLEPRGIPALLARLEETRLAYALTSSVAADSFSPIAPAYIAALYVENSGVFADELGLRPVQSGANVILVEPFDKVVFERTMQFGKLRTAAPSQVAVDLLTGPGREPSEGEELLSWMKENRDAWQT